MDDKTITVDELIRMFVAMSFFQGQRIFQFSDIYQYIERCFRNESSEYRSKIFFPNLINEAGDTIEELRKDNTISYVYPKGEYGMYCINNKIDFLELSRMDKKFIDDMIKVFYDIIGGEPYMMTLKLSRPPKRI